ncbi:cytochrome P450 [Herbihabitans rhizosphaerae]|uniref:Cytochrome P450 n=1 Tax=Herbihabitans rhizosphaerae TaxID=1872711 RepID=A0A4Q7L9U5_9PSEU|nr:cytochrome P450 [Herbihabitans rhizosphaerae]RZS45232.1 cytochrome P450 [Herbihabitans rhizosphaerae]
MGGVRLTGREALALLPYARRDALAFYAELLARHGDTVSMPVAPRTKFHVLSRPEHVAHVLVGNQANYLKARTYRPLTEVVGNGLLTSEGEHWARQRRLVQPMFSRRHVVSFGGDMASAATRAVDTWADDARIEAATTMSALALDVVGRALFGADLTGDAAGVAPTMDLLMDRMIRVTSNPLFWITPNYHEWRTPNRRKADAAKARLDAIVDRMIADRKRRGSGDGDGDGDLLDMLLAARDAESGTAMSEQQVRDELMTFMVAGHETTANTLVWTFSLLSTHPEARRRLESEVDSVLAGRVPDADDADKLEWTNAVVSEALRLYPPAWTLEREAIADDEVDGVRIRAGSMVATPPWLVHRHPEHWTNPEGFDPERFLPEAARGRHKFAYLPFGGGRRQCVGSGFAMLEAVLILAVITQRYRLDLAPGVRPRPDPMITLRPRGKVPMTVRAR